MGSGSRTYLDQLCRPHYDASMPARSSFTMLASTLEKVAERYGLASMLLEQRLQRRWDDIVGEAVAEDFRVTEPSQGVLLLKARRLGGLG